MSGLLVNESAPPWRRWMARYWPWLALGLILLLVAGVRLRLRDMPLERDEGEYAYMGQLMLHGVPPYKEACNMKLPGTYAAYALSMAVFGQTPSGIRLGLLLVNAGSIVLLFFLGRRLLDDLAGVVAAICYALLSLSPSVVGTSAHATQFIVLPALGGTLLLVKALASLSGKPNLENRGLQTAGTASRSSLTHPRLLLFLSGLLFGLAFLMKQHGLLFGCFGALYLMGVWLDQWFQARAETEFPAPRSVPPQPAPGRRPNAPSARPQPSAPQPAPSAKRLSHFAAGRQAQQATAEGPPVRAEKPPSGPTGLEAHSGPIPEPGTTAAPSEPSVPGSTLGASPAAAPVPQGPAAPGLSVLLWQLTLFGAGLALPYLLTCLLLWWAGVFPEFVFWTISYARQYTELVTASRGLDLFRRMLTVAVGDNFLLWLLPWAGALVMWWDDRLAARPAAGRGGRPPAWTRPLVKPEPGAKPPAPAAPVPRLRRSNVPCPRLFLVLLLLCSFGSVSIGFYFRQHYFVTLLPALALLSAVAVSRARWVVGRDLTLELFAAAPVLLLFLLAVGGSLVGNGSVWFALSPTQAAREVYGTTMFTETRQVGEYLKANTLDQARIAVLGSEPEIFFYSRRRSASKYLYVYPLMERQPFARKMQDDMVAELERAHPDYVVYADDQYSWLRRPDSEQRLDAWWDSYSTTNLTLVSTFTLEEGRASDTMQLVRRETPDQAKPEKHLLVYRRK